MTHNIKDKVMSNPILVSLLEQITNPEEKEKTLRVIEGMLQQMQGKADGLSKAYDDISSMKAKKEQPR